MTDHKAVSSGEHPQRDILYQFAWGELDEDALQTVSVHLETCATCLEQVRQFANADATLLSGLREVDLSEVELSDGDFELSSTQTDPHSDSTRNTVDSLGKYRVIKQLGAGGMGSVFLAEHLVMNRQIAIKVIRKEYTSNPEAVLRFKNEVRNAARLSHRNIVTAHDAEQVDDVHFLVMEYVPGESLSQLLKRKGRLSVTHACNYVLQVAHGLNHAHEKQMVHRDIKPGNLMRTQRGVIKILDFGLARVNGMEDDSAITTTGIMMGTADYIAPEQARDAKTADIRSDLYSLGCTLYFLLTGQPPFQADTKVDKILAHCSTDFPDASIVRDDIPAKVIQIINKLTEKDPDSRYQIPQELIDDLKPFGKPKSSTNDLQRTQVEKRVTEETSLVVRPAGLTSSVPSPSSEMRSPRFKFGRKSIVVLSILLLLIPLIWISVSAIGGNGGNPSASTGNPRPVVLLVMSADKFWYSDYEPVKRVLGENSIDLIVTSSRSGTARYNPLELDDAPNKRNVEIERSILQLVEQKVFDEVDAVVFIGTDTVEFRGNDATGQSVQRLLTEMRRQNKWITSIGKGNEVPLAFGFYDGIEVCDSQYLDRSLRRSNAVFVNERLREVTESKVLTCSMWHDAEDFSNRLAALLKKDDE